jgi:hypothetical protein
MDFCALLKCEGVVTMDDPRLRSIEAGAPPETEDIEAYWRKCGFSAGFFEEPGWLETGFRDPISRPERLSLDVAYRSKGGFDLFFSTDAVCLLSGLRWAYVLEPGEWRRIVLRVCYGFACVLRASEGVITRDESPIIQGFFRGMPFHQALELGRGLEGEVARIEDMYEDIPPYTWDSHGYWRLFEGGEPRPDAFDVGHVPSTARRAEGTNATRVISGREEGRTGEWKILCARAEDYGTIFVTQPAANLERFRGWFDDFGVGMCKDHRENLRRLLGEPSFYFFPHGGGAWYFHCWLVDLDTKAGLLILSAERRGTSYEVVKKRGDRFLRRDKQAVIEFLNWLRRELIKLGGIDVRGTSCASPADSTSEE